MSVSATPVNSPVDVLLTHSNHLASDTKQLRRMQPYPPLGTLYAATALRAAGVRVAVFDTTFSDPMNGFLEALERLQPTLVVIYEDDFNFVTKMCLTHMRELACRFAEASAAQQIPVIAHGSDATDQPELYLGRGVGYILNGEAEHALVELCSCLLAGEPPHAVAGLTYEANGQLISSPPAANNPAWTSLPVAARDLIDLEPYRALWTTHHGRFSTNIVASRGCPFRCNWCAKPISGNRFQLRPAEQVAAESYELKTRFGVQHLWFGDDVFALDRHWLEAFADAVQAHGTPLPFKIQSRADLLSATSVAALKRAGCEEIWIGVESGSQKILNAMDKGIEVATVVAARARLADAGIRACFFLQLGYPGERWPEILETIALVRETRPDDIGVSISYPLPGTVFFDRMQQQLGRKRNWADSGDLCALHTACYEDDFYHAVRDALHAEVSAFRLATHISAAAALWERVHELEPLRRHRDVLSLPATLTDFYPIGALTRERMA